MAIDHCCFSAYVHLGYGFDAERYRQLYEKGLAPDPVPYGFHHATEFGPRVTYSTDHGESKILRLMRRAGQKLLGFDLIHAYRNRSKISEADVIWTMEEKQYLAVLFLARLIPSLRNKKVFGQTIWLFDRWKRMHWIKRFFLAHLIRSAAALTVHSRNYVGLPELAASSIHTLLLPFGVSQDSFPLNTQVRDRQNPIRILSMGTDPTRDWKTLLAAFGNDERFEVIVITKALSPDDLSSYNNISIKDKPTIQTFQDSYNWADFVVVSMSTNLYSGITVALEATSMGVPVVCSATGGVPTYFDPGEVLYVRPQNPEELREAVLNCQDDQRAALVQRAQRRFAAEDYSTRGMAWRYVQLSQQMLAANNQSHAY